MFERTRRLLPTALAAVALAAVALAAVALASPATPARADGDEFEPASSASTPPDELDAELRETIAPFLESYCLDCHGSERPKAGVDLSPEAAVETVWREPRRWETAARAVRERAMPPRRKEQPDRDERRRFVHFVGRAIDAIPDDYFPPDPGHVVLRRLTRVEYDNTVRDLFGVDGHYARDFPADGGGGEGFDNNADTLFIPPLLLEKCFEAAREIVASAPADRVFVASEPAPSGDDETTQGSARKRARRLLEHHLPRIFRRPASDAEVDDFLAIWEDAARGGASFEDGVRLALSAALTSPKFLFRVEYDRPADGPYRVDDFELASRLSYFLWSTMPDDELFETARSGRLSEPAVLESQLHRMLDDPRSRALAEGFAGQWLGVASLLTTVRPDPRRFPEYTDVLRDSLFAEVVHFFDHLVRADRPLLEILRADYSFLDERLARHYGVEGVSGGGLRRVRFDDPKRGGVLGMGAVHALTSYPRRTSPVLRGKWVLETLLGTPPPPPPPNAPGLSEDDRPRDGLTFRQRLERHRDKPQCASCHETMDPIGFTLEHYDVIGRWRDEIGGAPVDASGTLPTGETFQGPGELERILLDRRDLVVRNLVEKMLSYALGRGLGLHDLPTVRKIVRALDDGEAGLRTLIVETARSYPFRHRKNVSSDIPPEGSDE